MESLLESGRVPDDYINLAVSLPSGRCVIISVLGSGRIVELKIAAQKALGQPFLRLAAPDRRLLDSEDSLRHSGLRDGWLEILG